MLNHMRLGSQVEQIRSLLGKMCSDLPVEAKHSAASVFKVLLFSDRACMFPALFLLILCCTCLTCLSTQGTNAFKGTQSFAT